LPQQQFLRLLHAWQPEQFMVPGDVEGPIDGILRQLQIILRPCQIGFRLLLRLPRLCQGVPLTIHPAHSTTPLPQRHAPQPHPPPRPSPAPPPPPRTPAPAGRRRAHSTPRSTRPTRLPWIGSP